MEMDKIFAQANAASIRANAEEWSREVEILRKGDMDCV